jgi:hypothetical protein
MEQEAGRINGKLGEAAIGAVGPHVRSRVARIENILELLIDPSQSPGRIPCRSSARRIYRSGLVAKGAAQARRFSRHPAEKFGRG